MPGPNFLFLMADQLQAEVLDPSSPCRTPNLDRLMARGVRFERAYTPNPVCSPARASLMTGLLPHNHGVLTVTHTVDPDQSAIRPDKPHWAMKLRDAGYRTGYFGKWHVSQEEDPTLWGWETSCHYHDKKSRSRITESAQGGRKVLESYIEQEGYPSTLHHAVTDLPASRRALGLFTNDALDFLAARDKGESWCCFLSFSEPHDPFMCSEETYKTYDVDSMPLPASLRDPMTDKPGAYRKAARAFAGLDDRAHREKRAIYYGSITEIDEQWGRVLDWLDSSGQVENTVVVVVSDHGDFLGAHGLYCKNVGAFEEAYRIPLIVAGPGAGKGAVSQAKVGSHDLCPTVLELAGLEPFGQPDSQSFAPLLESGGDDGRIGFAEFAGTRYFFTQRVVWDGRWKLVMNGFDVDELYDLEADPSEMRNLAEDPGHAETLRDMTRKMWAKVRETGDKTLLNTGYCGLRLAPYGPGV